MSRRGIAGWTLFLALGLVLAGCKNQPAAPAGAMRHTATLTWKASTSKVSAYRIYRSTNPTAEPGLLAVTPGDVTEYADTTVQSGKTYYYSVKAVSPNGTESELAAKAVATIPEN
jgi:fibronectin type 3 domain-containing protein